MTAHDGALAPHEHHRCPAGNEAGAKCVVIGGFAVIAHQHIRATEDTDLLIPDDAENDVLVLSALRALGARRPDGEPVTLSDVTDRPHLRVDSTAHGLVYLLREGELPVDFATVMGSSAVADVRGVTLRFAGLESLVALKRLAGRPRDRYDLEALEAIHGPLPMGPLPGLDDAV